MMVFLGWKYYGNTVQAWLLALLITVLVLLFLLVCRKIITRRLSILAQRTKTKLDDLVTGMLQRTHFLFLLLLSFKAGMLVLTLPPNASGLINKVLVIALLIQAAFWGNEMIMYMVSVYLKDKIGGDQTAVATITALGLFGRLALVLIVILLILDNLNFKIDALIAGLGIGGIAVALAVQNVLGDLLGSLSIILDKPFVIGDFIVIDDFLGTVEHIGLKSTRIRSLSGEQVVFSNNDLLRSRIRNYKRMFERRVLFSVGVTYQTPYEKLAAIPAIIRKTVEAQQHTRFDRAHFKEYGAFSLDFEIVYYVLDPDYNLYMDIQQAINLAIFHRFQEEGIEFAYPTQTLFVSSQTDSLTAEKIPG